MSAYACEPNKGSEPGVGWNWAKHMSNYNDIIVITRSSNRDNIEKEVVKNKNENIRFEYFDLPKWLRFWKKGNRGVHIYYKIWQLCIYFKAKQIIKKHDIDLVHHVTFNEFRTPGYLWRLNKPFVLGPIGGAQHIPNGFERYYKKHLFKEKVRKLINSYYKSSLTLKKALKKSKYIIFANTDTYNFLYNDSLINKSAIFLETGINEENIKTINEYRDSSVFNLMWAGNIIYRKALIILLEALRIVDIPNLRLNVVGEGELRKECEEFCNKNNLQEVVNFCGSVNHSKMDNLYQQCDVFIFTSLRDTSGNVVLEAMANGKPVVVINHHGVADIVSEKCGIKIDPISPEYVVSKLAEAIELLYKDNNLRNKMGIEAQSRIKSEYLWTSKSKKMQKIYERVIQL
ncbi:glycosyltransferase family 4 protein [Clostridium sp.]|uniref:glycosyltransferase family 4 protein n=1 Tax=Clostridium sp. TaxID=1506 RepID=UPI003D6D7C70